MYLIDDHFLPFTEINLYQEHFSIFKINIFTFSINKLSHVKVTINLLFFFLFLSFSIFIHWIYSFKSTF